MVPFLGLSEEPVPDDAPHVAQSVDTEHGLIERRFYTDGSAEDSEGGDEVWVVLGDDDTRIFQRMAECADVWRVRYGSSGVEDT